MANSNGNTQKDGKVLVWQWGRFGAGPRFAYEMALALRKSSNISPLLSLSRQSELYTALDNSSAVDFPIDTYTGAADALRQTLRLPRLMRTLQDFVAREQPMAAISIMPGYWDVIAAKHLIKLGLPLITLVHDAQSHPGDWLQPIIAMHQQQISKSAGIVTLTDFVANILKQRELLQDHCHQTIAHPVLEFPDLALPAPPSASQIKQPQFSPARPLRLILPGRLKRYKGAHLLLAALEKIDPRLVEVTFAGAGGDENWIAEAKARPNCQLDLRWQSERELVSAIDKADILMAPYIEASQSGVVAVALGRGKPVIVTPVGGLPEQVRHNVTGLVAQETSATALATSILRFVEEPQLYQSCAAGALTAARGEIGWPQIASEYANFMRKVATDHSRRTIEKGSYER